MRWPLYAKSLTVIFLLVKTTIEKMWDAVCFCSLDVTITNCIQIFPIDQWNRWSLPLSQLQWWLLRLIIGRLCRCNDAMMGWVEMEEMHFKSSRFPKFLSEQTHIIGSDRSSYCGDMSKWPVIAMCSRKCYNNMSLSKNWKLHFSMKGCMITVSLTDWMHLSTLLDFSLRLYSTFPFTTQLIEPPRRRNFVMGYLMLTEGQ